MVNTMSLTNLKMAIQQSLDKNLPKILEDAVENLQVKIKRKSRQNIEDRGATPTGGSGCEEPPRLFELKNQGFAVIDLFEEKNQLVTLDEVEEAKNICMESYCNQCGHRSAI